MDGILFPVLAGIIGLAIGFFIAKMLEKSNANKLIQETKKEARNIVKEANKLAEAIKGLEVKITAKTGEGDKLFGSISNADLAEVLSTEGHELERKFITVAGGLVKRLGKYNATVRLHRDVIVELPFEVIAESK